eukprot:CAMPEP_0177667838 /NCGR_PEP_ID=MMETSP0447-20121125/22360_1 /TAXON_ID=0 /ORGANISM="Stygamoeba regulata, Strain BSH-02190019" /LENGTH=446 /DNA_ID=CAMNT_0019174143 /DNA_START=307 /DNA_END=1647 /DNA_ORIENTATION=-
MNAILLLVLLLLCVLANYLLASCVTGVHLFPCDQAIVIVDGPVYSLLSVQSLDVSVQLAAHTSVPELAVKRRTLSKAEVEVASTTSVFSRHLLPGTSVSYSIFEGVHQRNQYGCLSKDSSSECLGDGGVEFVVMEAGEYTLSVVAGCLFPVQAVHTRPESANEQPDWTAQLWGLLAKWRLACPPVTLTATLAVSEFLVSEEGVEHTLVPGPDNISSWVLPARRTGEQPTTHVVLSRPCANLNEGPQRDPARVLLHSYSALPLPQALRHVVMVALQRLSRPSLLLCLAATALSTLPTRAALQHVTSFVLSCVAPLLSIAYKSTHAFVRPAPPPRAQPQAGRTSPRSTTPEKVQSAVQRLPTSPRPPPTPKHPAVSNQHSYSARQTVEDFEIEAHEATQEGLRSLSDHLLQHPEELARLHPRTRELCLPAARLVSYRGELFFYPSYST